MQFVELEPTLIRYERGSKGVYHVRVPTVAECQGVRFLCPKCFIDNHGPIGTHQIVCWSSSRGVPDEATPKPGRWKITGTAVHDITISHEEGKSDSIRVTLGCGWHGYVKDGQVTDA